jgi:beta-xylosidase
MHVFRYLPALLLSCAVHAQPSHPHTGSWGDQGNGTYINPVLYADYSDPEVIRVEVRKKAGRLFLFFDTGRDSAYQEKQLPGGIIYLRMQLRVRTGDNTCSYSADGKSWQPFGGVFETRFGYWKGTRVGLFSFNTERNGGVAAFDWFHYDYDGPKYAGNPQQKK